MTTANHRENSLTPGHPGQSGNPSGRPKATRDLAGYVLETTDGGRELVDALGITSDEKYNELVKNPWLACGEQHPTWKQVADLIYLDHISTAWIETNNR